MQVAGLAFRFRLSIARCEGISSGLALEICVALGSNFWGAGHVSRPYGGMCPGLGLKSTENTTI